MSQGRAVLVVSQNKWRLARAFMRMQEHYDSPEFRGKIFTFNQLRDWHKKTFGSFTYCDDWTGFNFPSSNLAPFSAGLFPHLTSDERALLHFLRHAGEHEYVAGAVKNNDYYNIVRHEYGHMMLFFAPDFRGEIIWVLRRQKAYLELWKMMMSLDVYHPDVIDDEIAVHAIARTYKWLGPDMEKYFKEIDGELDRICNKYFAFFLKNRGINDLLRHLKVVEL